MSPAQQTFLDIYGSTPERVDRDFYKATACGGHATFNPDGTILIGSIVEGSEAEFDFTIPADADATAIREKVADLEASADGAWREAEADITAAADNPQDTK